MTETSNNCELGIYFDVVDLIVEDHKNYQASGLTLVVQATSIVRTSRGCFAVPCAPHCGTAQHDNVWERLCEGT